MEKTSGPVIPSRWDSKIMSIMREPWRKPSTMPSGGDVSPRIYAWCWISVFRFIPSGTRKKILFCFYFCEYFQGKNIQTPSNSSGPATKIISAVARRFPVPKRFNEVFYQKTIIFSNEVFCLVWKIAGSWSVWLFCQNLFLQQPFNCFPFCRCTEFKLIFGVKYFKTYELEEIFRSTYFLDATFSI